MNKPAIAKTGLRIKAIYFLPVSSLKYIGGIALPSKGGNGIRLKIKSIRFSENITLTIFASISVQPTFTPDTIPEIVMLSG